MPHPRFLSPAILATFVLSVAACGGSSGENPPPADPAKLASAAPSATPSAAPTAAPSAAPETQPAASAGSGKLVHDADGPDGVRRWALWDGPKTGPAITTEQAWTVVPRMTSETGTKLSFGSVHLELVNVVKADANEVVYTSLYDKDEKYAVPAALARPAVEPKGLKKGSFALFMAATSSAIGRVETLDESTVTFASRFMDETHKSDADLNAVLAFEGPFGLGSPVMVRFDGSDELYAGWIVATTGEQVWVYINSSFVGSGNGEREGRHVHKVKKANVTPIDVSKPLAVGAPCVAPRFVTLEPCTVKKVIDGGIAYVVTYKERGGKDEESLVGTVAPAPQEAKAAK
jgi:hypothetical protein